MGCGVIKERDVENDEIAEDSRSIRWREDDTNLNTEYLKQEMPRSVGANRGRRHVAHDPVRVSHRLSSMCVSDEVKELQER